MEVDASSPNRAPKLDDLLEVTKIMRRSEVPSVVVMKTIGSRPQHECVLGDGMGKMFQAAHGAGVVSDGGARDLEALTRLGLPVFGRGAVCGHASLAYKLAAEPAVISDMAIDHGDLLHGDQNGVHLIPAPYHHAIIEACCLTRDFETHAPLVNRRCNVTAYEKR